MHRLVKKNGFTLIEVLIAVFILAIGLMAMAALLTKVISGNAFSRDGTIAVELAQEMVDRVRTNAGSSPEIYAGIDTSGNCGGLVDPALGDCSQWQARLQSSRLIGAVGTVTVTKDTPINKSATVTVTITWGAITGLSRRVTFTTILPTWIS